jgi:hypothetical protein
MMLVPDPAVPLNSMTWRYASGTGPDAALWRSRIVCESGNVSAAAPRANMQKSSAAKSKRDAFIATAFDSRS